jgi:di/tricarboxylate transporter
LATGIGTTGLFWLLNLMYCLLHYGIASQTAHVTALVPPFLQIMMDAGERGTAYLLLLSCCAGQAASAEWFCFKGS